jgi:hypothetical protein
MWGGALGDLRVDALIVPIGKGSWSAEDQDARLRGINSPGASSVFFLLVLS